jgi:thiol-disulfide isomerase/thioredoxin
MKLRLAIWLLALFASTTSGVHAQTVGEKARLNHVELFDGTRLDPKATEGRVTLVYFWASWCPICRKEMPAIEKHYQAFKDRGFTVVAINFRDKLPAAQNFVESMKPISYLVGSINDAWMSDYPKLNATPTWMLIDKKGVIRTVIVGKEVISGGWFDGLEGDLKKVIAE